MAESAGAGLRDGVEALLAAFADGPLPIVQAGHPVLRRPAHAYSGQLGAALLGDLVAAMTATMHAAPGVGLAAPQVGVPLAIAVVHDPGDPDPARSAARERTPLPWRVLVNPTWSPVGEAAVGFYEGCLSVPGYQAVRSRARRVRLVAEDLAGTRSEEELTGWAARIVQHECDHLAGELYLDRAELRSLCADDYLAAWAAQPLPRRAAEVLGFTWADPGTDHGDGAPQGRGQG